MSDELTTVEADELADMERVIERGFDATKDAGMAFAIIRERRLYRATHATFADYCRDRWGKSARRAYQLIEYANFLKGIENNSTFTLADVNPGSHPQVLVLENEKQHRAFKRLPPDRQRDVVEVARETAPDGEPTPKHFGTVVKRFSDAARADRSTPGIQFGQPTEVERLRTRIAELDRENAEIKTASRELLAAEEAARTNRHDVGVLQRWRLALGRLRELLTDHGANGHHPVLNA